MDVFLLGTIFAWAAALGYTTTSIIYGSYGRWRDTAVGTWYLFQMVILAAGMWFVIAARGGLMPQDSKPLLSVILYGLLALGAAGTLPTVTRAIFRERQRRNQRKTP